MRGAKARPPATHAAGNAVFAPIPFQAHDFTGRCGRHLPSRLNDNPIASPEVKPPCYRNFRRSFVRSLSRIITGRPQTPPSLKDNPLLATIILRRTIRRFSQDPVPDDVFAAIFEAGRLAPSTVNLQTWSFGVFTPESWRETFGQPMPFRGQRAVIVLGDTHRTKTVLDEFAGSPLVLYTVAVMNASLAAMAMNIAAEALGVSSVMLSESGRTGLLDAGYLKDKLSLPEDVFPLMTIIFGYASGVRPPMPPKLPMEEITFTGRYNAPDPKVMATGWRK